MKIDLTKEEWEFLKISGEEALQMYNHMKIPNYYEEKIKLVKSIEEKLGSEWIDDEEEFRKFTMGFAYKPKEKN